MEKQYLDIEIEPLDISDVQDQFSQTVASESTRSRLQSIDESLGDSKRVNHDFSTTDDSLQLTVSSAIKPCKEEALFIKLRLPRGRTYTCTAYQNMKIRDLRKLLADEFQVPTEMLDLWDTNDLPRLIEEDDDDLSSLGFKPRGIMEFFVNTRDPDTELYIPPSECDAPVDILTVIIDPGSKHPRQVVVEVESSIVRRFLGGFRCKSSNKEYLHAESQTLAPSMFSGDSFKRPKRSRPTQTNEIISCEQQTVCDQTTQTSQHNSYEQLTYMEAQSIHSFKEEDEEAILNEKAVTLQRMWRGWLVRQALAKIRSDAPKVEYHYDVPEDTPSTESSRSPKYSPAVFEVLYQLVEQWRKKCLDHAYASKTQGPTRADFQDILEMQVNLLAVIEQERIKMRAKVKEEKERKMLEKSCSPVTWKGYKGLTISMDTIHSQRAAELKKLYDLLSQEKISCAQHRENLNTIQCALKSQKNGKCSEILNLINRELQLLDMGFGSQEVENLQKRIKKLFVDFIQNPSESSSFAGTPKESFYLCVRCKKMMPPTSFVIPLGMPDIKLCASCNWLDNVSHKRVDHNPYQKIIQDLRNDEMKRSTYNSYAFIMDVSDVCYLVDQIWHCQSAISQSSELSELRLGRWDSDQEWSPWNTILLTKSELKDHVQIKQLDKVYGQDFIKNVKVKLLMAQMHFKSLLSCRAEF